MELFAKFEWNIPVIYYLTYCAPKVYEKNLNMFYIWEAPN